MADTPEDRGPDSTRVIKFDAKDPIHKGIANSRSVNRRIDVSMGNIYMNVKSGNEAQPPLSGRYSTNEESANYELPAQHRVDLNKYIKENPSLKELSSKLPKNPAAKTSKKAAVKPKPAAKPAAKPAEKAVTTTLSGLVDPTAPTEDKIKKQRELRELRTQQSNDIAARIKAARAKN